MRQRLVPALLRQRDYRLLWTAHTGSVVGDGLHSVAITWLTYSTLGAGAPGLAALGIALVIPNLALGILSGTLVDRWDRTDGTLSHRRCVVPLVGLPRRSSHARSRAARARAATPAPARGGRRAAFHREPSAEPARDARRRRQSALRERSVPHDHPALGQRAARRWRRRVRRHHERTCGGSARREPDDELRADASPARRDRHRWRVRAGRDLGGIRVH